MHTPLVLPVRRRSLIIALALGAAILVGGTALPAERQEASPGLRIETGTHQAPIRGLSIDRAGRYLVTGAEDKTARVWEAATGRLVQVFRPPSASGNEGKLFAVAMMADGSLFAAAGWSATNDVYLVQRTGGQLIHRITGLPNVITRLAFSPDGRLLAVGLWGGRGVRLFAASDGWQGARELAGDADVGGDVLGLAWSPDGRWLATSGGDGAIRVHEVGEQGLRLALRKPPEERALPHGIAFSPDGERLLVGAGNEPLLTILDARSLRVLARIRSVSGSSGGLSSVAWGRDGTQVYGAGTTRDSEGHFTLCLADRHGDLCKAEFAIGRNTVTGLVTSGEGRLHYATADPAWGSVDGAGRAQVTVGADLLDFRDRRRDFSVSPDGAAVQVAGAASVTGGGTAFDLRALAWTGTAKDWRAPTARVGARVVSDWFESGKPAIDGRTITLEDQELSLSATVSAKGDRVALATGFYLRCYSENARELWRTPVPATPWQVNFSGDGRWLVAAFSDGTIRWFRVRDGLEQVALLVHPDRRRWVAWSPKGYYAVSPGGEDLIGWQVDRGPARAADFFPVSRFRDRLYRPQLLAAIVENGDEGAALAALALAQGSGIKAVPVEGQLPPIVRILAPEDGSMRSGNQARLQVLVDTAADAPLLGLRARINGAVVTLPEIAGLRAVKGRPDERPTGNALEVPVPLPEADADIMIFAENRHGYSPPAVLRILRPAIGKSPVQEFRSPDEAAAPASQGSGGDLRPALYVLAIGVSRYADKTIQLEYSAKDARDFSTLLRTQEGRLYRKVAVRLLTDGGARRDDVLDGLEWIRRESTARDVGVVFLAGHGVNDADGIYYFLPHDTEVKRLKRTGVIFTEIRNTLVSLPGKALFFVDTCHSGNILGTGLRALANDTTAIVNELASAENGVVVFTATTGRQYAQESDNWGNGAFTKALLEGLQGKADLTNSGRVTHKMLDLYVSERVKALTEGAQSPVTIVPRGISDFPVAIAGAGRR